MINTDNIRLTVAKGLKNYLGCPVIRADQNEAPPAKPYGTYKITTPATANGGTYGEYEDGKARKPIKQIWSLSFLADTEAEALSYANKARTWLDYVGTTYLNDNEVIVEQVGAVGNRNNILTAEYEYKYGFDCTFWGFDEIEMPETEAIEAVELGETTTKKTDYEAIIKDLQHQLDIANALIENQNNEILKYEAQISKLETRLKGGE